MNHARIPLLLALFGHLAVSVPARAGFVYGLDAGVGPGHARPQSDGAFRQYESATAGWNTRLITFDEGVTPGQPGITSNSINLGQGITLESNRLDPLPPPGFQYGLTNLPNSSTVQSNARLGYNISGTSRFTVVPLLNSGTASVLFRSTTVFSSVGFYLTGLGNQTGQVELILDGVDAYRVAGASDGGVLFVGYTGNPENQFRTMELRLSGITGPNRDVFAIDDLRFSVVPEPTASLTLGVGLTLSVLFSTRSRRRLSA